MTMTPHTFTDCMNAIVADDRETVERIWREWEDQAREIARREAQNVDRRDTRLDEMRAALEEAAKALEPMARFVLSSDRGLKPEIIIGDPCIFVEEVKAARNALARIKTLLEA